MPLEHRLQGRLILLSTTHRHAVYVALLPADVPQLTQAVRATSDHALEATSAATAIVIDTLRFTTSACQALSAGAGAVHVAASVEGARHLALSLPDSLLCGERHCHRIDGFDLGNSPLEYTAARVAQRELVFTTTNGTRAIEAVRQLPQVLLGAMVNRQAVCRYVQQHAAGEVWVVCAGTDGQLTWEDLLTAGAILHNLVIDSRFEVGHDPVRMVLTAWQAVAADLSSLQLTASLFREFSRALGGKHLLAAGYEDDLHFAAQLDTLDIVPRNSPSAPHVFRGG